MNSNHTPNPAAGLGLSVHYKAVLCEVAKEEKADDMGLFWAIDADRLEVGELHDYSALTEAGFLTVNYPCEPWSCNYSCRFYTLTEKGQAVVSRLVEALDEQ